MNSTGDSFDALLDAWIQDQFYENKADADKVPNPDPVKVIQADYAFCNSGVRPQYMSDSHSMVWYKGGFLKLRLKILNPRYREYSESFAFSVTIKVHRYTGGLLSLVSEEVFAEYIDEPENNVVERYFELKGCKEPASYQVQVYCNKECVLDEKIFMVDLPEPYVSAAKFSTLFLHRVDKGKLVDYENLGPQYSTFDINDLGSVLLGVSYELNTGKDKVEDDVNFPLAVDVFNEQGYKVWHECQGVTIYEIEGVRYICGFFEIGSDDSLPWKEGSYRVDVRFFDELMNSCTFYVGSRNVEYQFNKTELVPRLSTVGKKHISAEKSSDDEKRRMYNYLLRKGFRMDDICKVLKV